MAGDFSPLTIQADHGAPRAVPPALVLAMAVGLGTMDMPIPSVVEWEWLNWRFPRPVHSGDTIYARWTLTQKRPPASGAATSIVVWRVDVHTADGAMCAEGEVGAKVRRSAASVAVSRSRAAEPAVRQKAGGSPAAVTTTSASAAPRRRRRRRPGGGNGSGPGATPEAASAPTQATGAGPATGATAAAERTATAPRRRRRRRPASASGQRDSAEGPAPAGQVGDTSAAPAPAAAATPAPAASGRPAKSPLSRVIGRLRGT